MGITSNIKNYITGVSQYCFLYYIMFALMGVFLRIHLGLYGYDIIVIAFVFFVLLKKPVINHNIGQYLFTIWTILLIPAAVSIAYQIITNNRLTVWNFYIVHNLFILSFYITFISLTIKHLDLNYNIVLILVSIPVFLSIAMFFSPAICHLLDIIYSADHYPGRFGGIFGRDVNQLGYHSTLVIILASYLKVKQKINLVFYPIVLLSLFAIAISGMRTGIILLVFFFPLLNLFTDFKIITLRDTILLVVLVGFVSIFFTETITAELGNIKDRFSVELLYNQITDPQEQHIASMYKKVFSQMYQIEKPFSVLLSFMPKWKFPDSFIIYIFANGGLMGFFSFFIFAVFNAVLIARSQLKDKAYLFFVLIFNILICIKGNYMFNNTGMFIFVFTVMMTLQESGVQMAPSCRVTQKINLQNFSNVVFP